MNKLLILFSNLLFSNFSYFRPFLEFYNGRDFLNTCWISHHDQNKEQSSYEQAWVENNLSFFVIKFSYLCFIFENYYFIVKHFLFRKKNIINNLGYIVCHFWVNFFLEVMERLILGKSIKIVGLTWVPTTKLYCWLFCRSKFG